MPNLDKPTLLTVIHSWRNSGKPLKRQINLIKDAVAKKKVTFDDLMSAINYLDIETLKAPLADAMIQDLYKNMEAIAN